MIRRVLILGAAALALGAALRFATGAAPAAAVAREPAGPTGSARAPGGDGERAHWREVWTGPAPGLAAMDLSRDGAVAAWADRDGRVRALSGSSGKTLWRSAPFAGVNRVVATDAGAVLAYAALDPGRPVVQVLRASPGAVSSGARADARAVEGAVWDVAVSPDGGRVGVGTGRRWAYVFPLDGGAAVRRWATPGIPESMAFAASRSAAPLVVATWQRAGVWGFALDGTPRWPFAESDPTRSYRVVVSGDGRTAVGVSARAPRETEAKVCAWDAGTGRLLWSHDLPGSQPRALVTRDGGRVAAAFLYQHVLRGGEVVEERKLALFDRSGRKLWEKGGAYFAPRPVAFSADGAHLTVVDGPTTLVMLDTRGRRVAWHRLRTGAKNGAPAAIRAVAASDDGDTLLVHRGDGLLTLLKAQ